MWDPRILVQQLTNLRGRVKGWYETTDSMAIQTAINVIVHFCYPDPAKLTRVNGSKIYSCPRCNKKIQRQFCFCPSCGKRILVTNG